MKTQKLFDTCKLIGKWKYADNSQHSHYEALEDGATIEFSLIRANFIESFRFKKSSRIIIKDSIVEFYDEDLFR
ncbi:MAG: hypothetical protein K5777_05175 [Nitrosopumilus sp.]|nr:hypothetical protein [Nitrosopumilus sp.]